MKKREKSIIDRENEELLNLKAKVKKLRVNNEDEMLRINEHQKSVVSRLFCIVKLCLDTYAEERVELYMRH